MYTVTATQTKTIIEIDTIMPDADNADHIVNGKVEVDYIRDNYKVVVSPLPSEVVTSEVIMDVLAAFISKAISAGEGALALRREQTGTGKQESFKFGTAGKKTGKAAPSDNKAEQAA